MVWHLKNQKPGSVAIFLIYFYVFEFGYYGNSEIIGSSDNILILFIWELLMLRHQWLLIAGTYWLLHWPYMNINLLDKFIIYLFR